jgi:hypothetical protein
MILIILIIIKTIKFITHNNIFNINNINYNTNNNIFNINNNNKALGLAATRTHYICVRTQDP